MALNPSPAESTEGFLSKADRPALAWLWRNHLRRYIASIAFVFALITIHGLAFVAFLAMINNNFTELFASDRNVYTFTSLAQEAHRQGQSLDANGDGIYDLFVEVFDDENKIVSIKEFEIAVLPTSTSTRKPRLSLDTLDTLELKHAQLSTLLDLQEATLGQISGADALHLDVSTQGVGPVLIQLIIILLGATMLRVIASYVSARMAARITALASLDIRRELIERFLSLDLAYFNKSDSGGIVLALNNLVASVQTFFSSQLLTAAKAAITILGIMGYLFWIHTGLFIFVAMIFPLAFLGTQYVAQRLRTYMQTGLVAHANFLTNLENTVGGIRTIKLSNQSNRARDGLMDDARDMANIQIRVARYTALITPMIDLLTALAVVLVVTLGGIAVTTGFAGLTASTLVTFVIGMALIISPASRLSGFNAVVLTTLVALRALYDLNEQKPEIKDTPTAGDLFDAKGDIEIKDVAFTYDPDAEKPLFEKLNMRFEGGKISALVGQTGSGKTSIFSLIARLYEVRDGSVTIGGTDIRQIKTSSLRNAFSIVTQDIFIFNATIKDNIRFIAPDASEAEVDIAAEKAQLTALIQQKGNQSVGPHGAQLSGGQKQRIAIARAFLKDAPIILLDEATSALDQKTESLITEALRELCENKTTLTIAHRLSTIEHADKIFVIENGQVCEQGTHKTLLEQKGLYSALYKAQIGQTARKAAKTAGLDVA